MSWGLGSLLVLWPTLVLACPVCAARAPESSGRSMGLVAVMMLVPFLLVAAGVWVARRAALMDMEKDP